MSFQERIESSIMKRGVDPYKSFHEVCFVLAKEFGWSYSEIVEAPLPFIIEVVGLLEKFNKEQIKQHKKGIRR